MAKKSGALWEIPMKSESSQAEAGNRDLPFGKPTKLWKITIFNGKTHYFYGHFQ